jgi:hypothetical protein
MEERFMKRARDKALVCLAVVGVALARCSPSKAEDVLLGVSNPTFSGLSSTVALEPLFRGALDGDDPLIFQIVGRNDPKGLISSVSISNGVLAISKRAGGQTYASVTVRATFAKPLTVYDNIYGKIGVDKPDTTALGMVPSQILTHYAFFTYDSVSKTYDTSKINETQLRNVVRKDINSTYHTVLDIEDETYFGNTLEGRERLGKVLSIVRSERPDIKALGYYMLMPGRDWWAPVRLRRAELHQSLGITTYWTRNISKWRDDYRAWLASNELYRTHILSDKTTVASKLGAVYPSLYVPYQDRTEEWGSLISVSYEAPSKTFVTKECGFKSGSVVNFFAAAPGSLPSPLVQERRFYVVNSSADGLRFQVSETPTGPPVQLASNFATRVYMNRINQGRSLCQDADVNDWEIYARENIAEARKYGKPVYAYISPTVEGAGDVSLAGEFWRTQLRTLRGLTDGVVIWDGVNKFPAARASTEWWRETEVFLNSQRPRTITFVVAGS